MLMNLIKKNLNTKVEIKKISKEIELEIKNLRKHSSFLEADVMNQGVQVTPEIMVKDGAYIEKTITEHPEVEGFIEEGIEEDEIEYVKIKSKTTTSRRRDSEEESDKIIFLVPYKVEEKGANDIEELYDILVKLENSCTKKPRQKKAFVKADGRSFAELLMTVKEKVNLKEKGLTI
ncbi:hypothetical protein JTB14_035488 [Gonioctena quinquepunctata]|nr:hypothetical protein JTB14_035488 [Gonioctena quinquepunctata]